MIELCVIIPDRRNQANRALSVEQRGGWLNHQSMLLFSSGFPVRFGISHIKEGRKLLILQPKHIRNHAGDHGGNRDQKIDPPIGIKGISPRLIR